MATNEEKLSKYREWLKKPRKRVNHDGKFTTREGEVILYDADGNIIMGKEPIKVKKEK